MENVMRSGPIDSDEARRQLKHLDADRVAIGVRAAAPWWLIGLHGVSVAGFALSFGLGDGQSVGFAVSALLFVGLGMIRPWVTGTHAEPWARSRRAVVPGVLQLVFAAVIIAGGVVAYGPFEVEWALWPTALLAAAATVLWGLRMERALMRDVAEEP